MSEAAKERVFCVGCYITLTVGVAFMVYAGENSMQYALGFWPVQVYLF